MKRAYSLLEVKSFDDDLRIIEGMATTPTPDRMQDVVLPLGAKFNLPLPLLWQHDARQPIGEVVKAKATADGISFVARLARIAEAGKLRDRLDEAWQSIKHGLVKGVSIGFNPTKYSFLKDSDGMEFQEWEWLELSAVTIPANSDASIAVIRALSEKQLGALPPALRRDAAALISPADQAAASGARSTVHTLGVAGTIKPKPKGRPMAKRTIGEMIADFENTRAAKAARMNAIMDDAGERNETLNAEETEEYDGLAVDVKSVDEHLIRLRNMQQSAMTILAPVAGDTAVAASAARSGPISVPATVKNPDDKGRRFANVVQSFVIGRGNWFAAAQFAEHAFRDRPEVALACKAAVAPLDTTTSHAASELTPYQILASEFVEFLYPLIILGRVPGWRRIPFNVRIPTQTGGSTTGWVGEGKAKPLTGVTFDSITLRWAKVAGIIPFTEELARFSNPAIEGIVRGDLAASIAKFLDVQLLDPAVTAVTNVSPASITNGAVHHASAGIDIPSALTDFRRLMSEFAVNNIPIAGSVIIMEPEMSIALGMLQNPLGQYTFAGLDASGGTLFGLPVFTSESVPNGLVVLVKPSEVLLADDGGVAIDVSREASLIMSDSPTSGASTAVSLWQNNLVAVKAERFINWQRRRDKAVAYLTGCNYGGTITL